MDTLLKGINISKDYQMGEVSVHALRNVNFEIYDGEFIVVLGPSGSGKSTLLNIIGGMDKPSSGELFFYEQPLHNADEKTLTQYRREAVGFVFQFYNLIPNLTAEENINLSVEIAKNPLKVEDVLKEIDLYDRKDHFPSQLSGGQQQRIAIARALAKNPKILLCDEPTGALDLSTGIQVLKLLKRFNEIHKKTVIVITHNTEISKIAHRIFYIIDGRIEKIENNPSPVSPEEVNW